MPSAFHVAPVPDALLRDAGALGRFLPRAWSAAAIRRIQLERMQA